MVSSPLHCDVKGGPLHLQLRAPPPGGALRAADICDVGMRTSSGAGLPQQEPERPCVQEAGAVELQPAGRLVVGESPGQKCRVGLRVD